MFLYCHEKLVNKAVFSCTVKAVFLLCCVSLPPFVNLLDLTPPLIQARLTLYSAETAILIRAEQRECKGDHLFPCLWLKMIKDLVLYVQSLSVCLFMH